MGNGKPTKCPICRKPLKSGKALGGHMSKHKAAKANRAATLAAKAGKRKPAAVKAVLAGLTQSVRERLQEVRRRIEQGVPAKLSAKRKAKAKAKAKVKPKVKTVQMVAPTEDHPMLKEIQIRLPRVRNTEIATSDMKSAGTTMSLPDAQPRVCLDLLAAAKRKRDEATKLEVDTQSKVMAKREEAQELVRLAERIGHIL